MSIVRNAIRSSLGLRAANPIRSLPFLGEWPRRFSTEAVQPPSSASPPSAEDPRVDAFLRTSSTGLVYGKLLGLSRQTLKTDIMNLLEGCNLTPDDIKFSYTRGGFMPMGILLQFPSRPGYDNALRSISKKGRLYRLERVDRSQWDLLSPYDGKAILLQGIPRNGLAEDVDRFLSGCDYDQTSMQFFTRPGFPDPMRMAIVRFPSQTQAMNAFITKNRGFCLNSQITATKSIGDAFLKRALFNKQPSRLIFRLPEPLHKPILGSEPSVTKYPLDPDDEVLIFSSDGLTEHFSNQEAVDIIDNSPRHGIAKRLVKTALKEAAKK